MAFTTGGFGVTFESVWENTAAVAIMSDTIKCALFTNTLTTPDFNTATAYGVAPYNAQEIPNATGYTTGGVTLGTKVFAPAAGRLKFTAANSVWGPGATFSNARGALVYDSTVSNLGIIAVSFGADFSIVSGTLTIQWHTDGIWYQTFA